MSYFQRSIIESMYFYNNTDLPVMVEGWVAKSQFLSTLEEVLVEPGEKKVVYSSVGEWQIHSMLKERRKWNEKGINSSSYLYIAKFSSTPCLGNYAWLEYEKGIFQCLYSLEKNQAQITLSLNQ